ncbi:N-acetylmuramoyl-L-alanine amidase [Akkermansiaceae bacterium]|nr:N-acetylmuramoyl-L-alanine amidase [Akkermansiaceae bacterium]MDA7896299.1 N-acetylmuramoyl-L-alanine amidase [bacterium]MDA7934320.1 N-acetylmuramoyl-L-alanine amidase [Akkermansiaceae bacterium]MDA9830563.1 N-acetylmuramoyl-L-alanine amidase [Akkermansiaceae bacterium]MDB4382615.1 N-acetylmuramoyl-L-alanine amidase [Akkermansiaceae bacterium]
MKSFLTSLILLSIVSLHASAGTFNTVVIDAGHGGRDNGGSYGKVYEKWLALDTALRVEKKLRAKGYKTVMTRRSDNFITLPGRAKIGNRYPNSIFVSIHYNFTWKRDVSGLETFYCSSRSKPLAAAVQKGMLDEVKSVNRGVKYARYYVIRHAQNPAILVEGGFVSNSKERGRTKEGWYREAIADGIVNGISEYKSLRRRGKAY